jgi:hypothetical protein
MFLVQLSVTYSSVYCIVLYCIVLYCIVLYYVVLYYIVLYCMNWCNGILLVWYFGVTVVCWKV